MLTPKDINKEKLIKLLYSILNNSHDMLENITQILEISKLKSDKLTYNYSLFDVNNIVLDVIEKFDSLIKEKKLTLILDLNDESLVSSDTYRVRQILSNIISNAIKYGNNVLTITVSNIDDVTICVEDNGAGIKDKEAIFNLYSQEDDDLLERKGQGTGIGLYFMNLLCKDLNIVHKVEDAHESSGTIFTIIFKKQDK